MDDALRIAVTSGRRFTGLRDATIDPMLWHYVPSALARRERIVPLALEGDVLRLAATTPYPDLSVLHARLPHLSVDVVLARAAEIEALLPRSGTGVFAAA